MTVNDVSELAARQLADYRARTPGTVFADGLQLGLDDAYAVQAAVAQLRERDGEEVAGFKVGCTSADVQRRFGMRGPVSGFLFAPELHPPGSTLATHTFANLAVEAETAVRLDGDLRVLDVFPVLELHNLVFRGSPATLPELVANNAIHAGAVLAPGGLHPAELAADAVLELVVDGSVVDSGPPFPLPGGAEASLRWLTGNLARVGRRLRPGDIVLTGTSLGIHEVQVGQSLVARLTGCPDCACQLV